MIKILVIEDNSDIRENIIEMLELAGFEAVSASNGKEGIELARATIPHLILSDLMMPVMNGDAVFDALKSDSATRDIPFVFITSSVERKVIDAAYEKGAKGYIKKPFDEQALLETIHGCLDERD